MDYFVYPLSGIRKEAASPASILRYFRLAVKGGGRAGNVINGVTLAGTGLGGVGGGVGANAAVNAYEKRRQQEDPSYKVSKLGRLGAITGGAAGGALGGTVLGAAGGLLAVKKPFGKFIDRGDKIEARHVFRPEDVAAAKNMIFQELSPRLQARVKKVSDAMGLGF